VRYRLDDEQHSIVSTATDTDTTFAMVGDLYTVGSILVARPTQAICPVPAECNVGSESPPTRWQTPSLEVSGGTTTASSLHRYYSGGDNSSDFRVGRYHHGSTSGRGGHGTVAHSRADSTLVLVLLCIVGITHALSARLLR
jgi:hypothetical protein